MKIDPRKVSHWWYLIRFGLNVVSAILWRPIRRRRPSLQVVLYGHKLNGNLLAIYRRLKAFPANQVAVTFLTLDPEYHDQLSRSGISAALATTLHCSALLSVADAIVTDHGLHAMAPMLSLTNAKFFDVWHGIPFKGFDADDFRIQHRYNETWVASPLLARLYVEHYGFDSNRVKVTGYARTDRLVEQSEDVAAIKERLGLGGSEAGKIVLFAPTWKQDAGQRSLFPFGVEEETFFGVLSELAERVSATFVMRAHLNSDAGTPAKRAKPRIKHLSSASHPDTEDVLLISDMLVCDWSSIAFDYLLLDRPTLFLDVEAPFAKGFSLGPEYRFGEIVSSLEELLAAVECYLLKPADYQFRYALRAAEIRRTVYSDFADGAASERCAARLLRASGVSSAEQL